MCNTCLCSVRVARDSALPDSICSQVTRNIFRRPRPAARKPGFHSTSPFARVSSILLSHPWFMNSRQLLQQSDGWRLHRLVSSDPVPSMFKHLRPWHQLKRPLLNKPNETRGRFSPQAGRGRFSPQALVLHTVRVVDRSRRTRRMKR